MLCGGCGAAVEKGAPIQAIHFPMVTRVTLRCVQCAEGAPPADLPALTEQAAPPVFPFARFDKNSLPLDFKKTPTRDPGEEG